jgi:hypothetical protein
MSVAERAPLGKVISPKPIAQHRPDDDASHNDMQPAQ